MSWCYKTPSRHPWSSTSCCSCWPPSLWIVAVRRLRGREPHPQTTETEPPVLKWHGLSEDPEDGKPKFPNFPPNTDETNRVPRDYTTASHSSALSRVSEVTTPSYPSNPSVSTTSHAGSGLRFSSITTTESTTKSSILGVLHSTTEGPIVFTLSPELQVQL